MADLKLYEAPLSLNAEREAPTYGLLAPTVYAIGGATPPPVSDPAWKVFGSRLNSANWDYRVHSGGTGPMPMMQPFEPLAVQRSATPTPPQQDWATVAAQHPGSHAPHLLSTHAYYLSPYNRLGRWVPVAPPAAGGLHFTADIPAGFSWSTMWQFGGHFEAQATMVVHWLPATAPPVPPSKGWLGVEIARSNTVSFSTQAESGNADTYVTKRMAMDVTVATADLPHPSGYVTYGLLLSVLDTDGHFQPGDLPSTDRWDMPDFYLRPAPSANTASSHGNVVPFITMDVPPSVGPHPFVVDGGKVKRAKQLFVVDGGKVKRAKQLFVVDGGKTHRVH